MSAGSNWFDQGISDTYTVATDLGRPASPAGPPTGLASPGPEPPRRPCPMCGEMIVIGAAKCRFCDAVFDENLRRSEKKEKEARGLPSSDYDEDLTAGDWVVCILCPGIGLLGRNRNYLCMGKPKAWKILGISGFLSSATWYGGVSE